MAEIQTETDIDEGWRDKIVSYNQEQTRIKEAQKIEVEKGKPNVKSKGTKHLCIILAIGAILLIGAGVVAGITVIVSSKEREKNSSNGAGSIEIPVRKESYATTRKPEETTENQVSGSIESNPGEMCQSKQCIEMVEDFKERANFSVDPCDDFEEYACGRFKKENVIAEDEIYYNDFLILQDAVSLSLKEIVEKPIQPQDSGHEQAVKLFYKSCSNEEKVEEKGVSEFLKENITKDWPTLQPAWIEEDFDLNDVIARHEAEMVEPLFKVLIQEDLLDRSILSLYITEPTLPFDRELYLEGRNSSIIMAYEAYLANLAVLLGANDTVANQDAKYVVDFEIALARITIPKEETRYASQQYNPVILSALTQASQPLDIAEAVKTALMVANIKINDNITVINSFPKYLKNLPGVLNNFSNRTIRNYFGFFSARTRLQGLTQAIRNLSFEFTRVLAGVTKPKELWKYCVGETSTYLWIGIGEMYMKNFFSESLRKEVQEMILNVKETFKSMVMENTWTSQATKDEAMAKLNALGMSIGTDESYSKETLNELVLKEDDFYGNRLQVIRQMFITLYKKLLKPVIRNEWQMRPFAVNAYYSPRSNRMVLTAAILQKPYYSSSYTKARNYATLGVFIGHEITHGFDDKGSQFDANGNVRNWWTQEDKDEFLAKTDCFVEQFGNFCVAESDEHINGVNTQSEIVADTEGLRTAYRAYKNATGSETLVLLPGMNLTQDQIFFLSFAQTLCEIGSVEYFSNLMATSEHPPQRYRVIGTLQNNEEFAEAFQCAQNTYMNPERKCSVW